MSGFFDCILGFKSSSLIRKRPSRHKNNDGRASYEYV